MQVKLKKMPTPKKQGVITLQNLHGGLNLHEDPTHVASNQSPDMLNMWYRDGMLKRRAGQAKVFDPAAGGSGTVCTACFSGEYPTAVPDSSAKDRFEKKIHSED